MPTEQPLLGRCKDCDYALFATQEDVQPAESFNDIKHPGLVYDLGNGQYFARCDRRHKVFVLHRIKGTFSKDHQCDSRCLNAKGHDCTCSCGGANHGRGHAATHHEAGSHAPLVSPSKIFLGEVGGHIKGNARVVSKRRIEASESTLYTLEAINTDATIKWFAPDYADPNYGVDQEIHFRAKVKRHEDHERFGRSTLVIYLEEQ